MDIWDLNFNLKSPLLKARTKDPLVGTKVMVFNGNDIGNTLKYVAYTRMLEL